MEVDGKESGSLQGTELERGTGVVGEFLSFWFHVNSVGDGLYSFGHK